MNGPTSLDDAFTAARAGREYEKTRLPKEPRERVDAIASEAERQKQVTREKQAARRQEEIDAKRAQILRETPTKSLEREAWTMRSPRRMKAEEREAMIERDVDHAFAREIATIDTRRDAAIDAVLLMYSGLDRSGDGPGVLGMRPNEGLSSAFAHSVDFDLGPDR